MLKEQGLFMPPDIHSLETVVEYGISMNKGRTFADVWDLDLFSGCSKCLDERTNRLIQMNLKQEIVEKIECSCNS
jgi:hypothetical protein